MSKNLTCGGAPVPEPGTLALLGLGLLGLVLVTRRRAEERRMPARHRRLR